MVTFDFYCSGLIYCKVANQRLKVKTVTYVKQNTVFFNDSFIILK